MMMIVLLKATVRPLESVSLRSGVCGKDKQAHMSAHVASAHCQQPAAPPGGCRGPASIGIPHPQVGAQQGMQCIHRRMSRHADINRAGS